ncbi:cation diffusion facilitator family transporter [Methanothermococcus okinawensis]|uniref:Cation diffusion facilitator family transporter n=1 Tax=Methanothermococcus okinawensis (strain DSM 14208 / JCM 11175 / IH1) TaxID=647113 RepID=F8ALX2_METOI|nr:cation diffusion facilitator family transporter [Methanothermococcus okinawensis]AEH06647.1 cation diffusion facilitator family transporter [Methanothermococcus okinawensis IH1]
MNIEKGKNVMVVSAILTLLVAVLKGIVGYISGSVALTADALHSLSDVLGPIAVYFGLKLAQKEPNTKFPYGYSRAESLASLAVSFIIFITGIEILKQSIEKFDNPTPIHHHFAAIFVMVVSLVITYYLYWYKAKVGKEIGSDAMIGEGAHSLVDFYTTIAVLFAVIGSYFGYYIVEPIVGGIISLIVIILGLKMIKKDIYMLMDYCDEETAEKIKNITLSVRGVEGAHHLKARKSGPYLFCDIHIEVDENLPFKSAHKISEEVVDKIKENIKNISDITVHIDPVKKRYIKVAIPTDEINGNIMDFGIAPWFSVAKYFVFTNIDTYKQIINNIEIKENPAKNLNKKRGIKITDFLINNGVDGVIVKAIGAGTYNALGNNYIKIIKTDKNTIKEAIEEFISILKSD